MGFLKDTWDVLKRSTRGAQAILDDDDRTGLKAVPTAADFAAGSPIQEAVFPLPETAPVVATGAAITVGRPLRFKYTGL